MTYGAHVNLGGDIYPKSIGYVWDPIGMSYVAAQQAGGGTGGGGDASAANQATEITKLTSIDAKTPALGQALAAASVPVVLPAAQQSALTPPAAITGYALDATVAKDGTDISAPFAMPAGGSGLRGWLSAIWTKLNGSLVVTQGTPANLQATVVGTDNTLGATVTPKAASVWDVSDRAARLLGVVASIANAVSTTSAAASQADGHSASLGATTDASSANTVIGRLKALVALLPLALSGSGALKVSQVDRAPTMGSGAVAAPTASAVIADTGPLPAGSYRIEWACAAQDTLAVGKGCVVEYRNAANSATTARLGGCTAGGSEVGGMSRLALALNERIRIIAGTAAGAASSQYVGFVAAYPVD